MRPLGFLVFVVFYLATLTNFEKEKVHTLSPIWLDLLTNQCVVTKNRFAKENKD